MDSTNRLRRTLLLSTLAVCLMGMLCQAEPAGAAVITFDEIEPTPITEGRIIDDEYAPMVTIRADNANRGPQYDLAVIFDSRQNGAKTQDPDLKSPWKGGNIQSEMLGNILIIEGEAQIDPLNPNFIDDRPNDEAGRPAGFIEFEFGMPIVDFGFDLIDVETGEEVNKGFFLSFQSSTGKDGVNVPFASFLDPSSPFFISDLEFGDNTANRINPITAALVGLTDFDRVQIHLGGSSGIDNIYFTPVPLPGALILLATGFIGFAGLRRKLQSPPH